MSPLLCSPFFLTRCDPQWIRSLGLEIQDLFEASVSYSEYAFFRPVPAGATNTCAEFEMRLYLQLLQTYPQFATLLLESRDLVEWCFAAAPEAMLLRIVGLFVVEDQEIFTRFVRLIPHNNNVNPAIYHRVRVALISLNASSERIELFNLLFWRIHLEECQNDDYTADIVQELLAATESIVPRDFVAWLDSSDLDPDSQEEIRAFLETESAH